MSAADFESRNNDFYAEKLARHGATHRGVDFNSDEAMWRRFEQLLKIRDREGRFSINDYGCGYGALYAWLATQGLDFDYRGFDLSPRMLSAARELHGEGPARRFVASEEELAVADYTIAGGIFNLPFGTPPAEWSGRIEATIQRLARLSRLGFAFNALTSYSEPDKKRPDLFYADPCALFDYCAQRVSRRVALLHDSTLWDFTILVRFGGDRADGGPTR